MELDVSFVCQRGEIEAMACMLAASLRRHHGNRLHLHAIEPIPASEYGEVSDAARRFLDSMGVTWYRRENPISHEYKIFNKLNAFRIEAKTDKTLFLDSDILVRGPLDVLEHYFGSQFAARLENQQRYSGSPEAWERAYGLFGLPVPEARWTTIDTSEWGPPYFNAGVVLADSSLDFSEIWSDTCRRIHEDETIWQIARDQHRGTVQIGMPVAMARLNLRYELLSGAYHIFVNRQMRRRRLNWPEAEVRLVHYNEWTHVLSDERLGREVGDLIRDFKLDAVFEAAPETQQFLETLRSADYEPRRTMFLPTSRLKAASESPLAAEASGPVRVIIMPGAGVSVAPSDSIEVRTNAGAVLDILTLAHSQRSEAEPRTLLIVAAPAEAIARWRGEPEFWTASVLTDPALDEAPLSDHARQRLDALRQVEATSLRRAGLWELLATTGNQPHATLRILRAEDLGDEAVVDAAATWCGTPLQITRDSTVPEPLAADEALQVRQVCSFIAGAFGYTL